LESLPGTKGNARIASSPSSWGGMLRGPKHPARLIPGGILGKQLA